MHNILLVDSDQEILQLTARELKASKEAAIHAILSRAEHVVEIPDGWLDYSVFTADNLEDARQVLNNNDVAMVFVDPMMPEMQGMQLVLYMQRAFPDTPAVLFTDFLPTFADKEMKSHVLRHYIERPYNVGVIQLRIFEILLVGVLDPEFPIEHGVALPSILQLIRNGSQACTLRLQSNTKNGYISFLPGNLVDAGCNGLRGEEAILELLSWENTTIGIMPGSSSQRDLVPTTLPQILSVFYESVEPELPDKEPRNVRKMKEFLQYLLAGIDRYEPKRRLPSLLSALRGLTATELRPKPTPVVAMTPDSLLQRIAKRKECQAVCLTDATGKKITSLGENAILDREICRLADMLWLFGNRLTGKQKTRHIVVAGEKKTYLVVGLKAEDGLAYYLLVALDPDVETASLGWEINESLPELEKQIVQSPETS